MEELVFTPSAVLSLLTEIEELKGKDISFTENEGMIKINIGESQYNIDTTEAIELTADDYSVETIADANEEGYEDLQENSDVDFVDDEPIEGGIIKEAIKTLLLGGLVKMTTKSLADIAKK